MSKKNTQAVGKKETPKALKAPLKSVKAGQKPKPIAKKLKTRKLEDRIAPGMVGGGLVDPGMADYSGEAPEDAQAEDQSLQTDTDSTALESGEGAETGNYVDDSSASSNYQEPTDANEVDSDKPDNLNSDYASFDNNYDSGAAPVDDAPAWKEPDWVTANADGSVHVQPPAGVSIEGGIANFPLDVANDALPLPEDVTIQSDGSVDVALPEGAAFNADTNVLTVPGDDFDPQQVPEAFTSYENPDGSWNVQLPADGVSYDADTNTLSLSNEIVNEIAPNNIEINTDGSVDVTLPENTVVNADGSFDMPPGSEGFMDNPPPEYVEQLDFAEVQQDGSVQFELTDGATVEDGIATFPHEMVDELPIPEEIEINADGSMDITVPEGASWDADSGALTLPAGTIHEGDLPEGIEYTVSPEGAYNIILPEGMSYDAEAGAVHCSNYWANEIAPDPIQINTDGSISCELPPGTDVSSDSEFTIPAEQTNFLETPVPEYVADAAFAEPLGDGSYEITPPPGVTVVDGEMQFPYEAAVEHLPLPEGIALNTDGTMTVQVPEGTSFDAEANALTFPAGTVQVNDLYPQSIDYANMPAPEVYANDNGSVTMVLPEGIEYNNGACTLDNSWANAYAPPAVEIHDDGAVDVKLPSEATYRPDGTVIVESAYTDFVDNPEPTYVAAGPDWVEVQPTGAVAFDVPNNIEVSPSEGTMTLSTDQVIEHFENEVHDDVTLNADGTMDVKLPEGTTYDAETGVLSMPAESCNINEVPPEVHPYIAPDGSVCVMLPEGIEYNADTGTVHCDNYWTNELAPQNVEIQNDGTVEVQLPPTTQYHEDGSFTIPEGQANFIAEPIPEYVCNSPEWVTCEPNGAVTFEPPATCQVNPSECTMTMPMSAVTEHFENQLPDEATLHPDGSMDLPVPEGTTYSADANSLTFPAGTVGINDIPEGITASVNDAGLVTVVLPDGIDYEDGVCHFDNYWTNEVFPPSVEITPEGSCTVQLPSDTQFHQDGSFSVPPYQADFVENPEPAYVANGPEWAEYQPNGGVTFTPPESFEVSPDQGTVSVPATEIGEHFADYLPPEMTINADGSMDIQVPEGTVYNASAETLTFPAGTVNAHEVPTGIEATTNPDGTLTVVIPEGIEYSNGSCHCDNYWTNEILPPHVDVGPDGMVQVQLPSDTYYHSDGGFSIPPESTDFMNNPEPSFVSAGPEWTSMNPDGSIMFTPPPGEFQINESAGTVTMPVDALGEHFDNSVPDDVTFNSDGTMDVQLPEGTTFANGVLTFPEGSMNVNEIPEALNPQVAPDGTVSVALPHGITYDAATGSVHCDNHWTNELTPDHMEFQSNGNLVVTMPENTQYFAEGVVMPAEAVYNYDPAMSPPMESGSEAYVKAA